MKFASLTLENFRRFNHLYVDFNPELTVILGSNGEGKTSVLEAAAIAISPFVKTLSLFRNGASNSGMQIEEKDVRYTTFGAGHILRHERVYPASVRSVFADPAAESAQAFTNDVSQPRKSSTHELVEVAGYYVAGVPSDTELPVIRYFSLKRGWSTSQNKRPEGEPEIAQTRTAGYRNCIEPSTDFGQFRSWFEAATLAHMQNIQLGIPSYLEDSLKGVTEAVEMCLEGEEWGSFHYSFLHNEAAVVHPEHGPLPVSMLSDGVRSIVALTADLAQRCVRLNPHLGADAPARTPGIVLIDEVDLHLHPEWQQRVLPSLQRTFPLVQFIISTHSPQVLSTVSREHVRVIERTPEGSWLARTPETEVVGLKSSEALLDVMRVDPIPDVREVAELAEYNDLIDAHDHDSERGRELRSIIEARYGSDSRVVQDLERYIRFQRIRLKREAPHA